MYFPVIETTLWEILDLRNRLQIKKWEAIQNQFSFYKYCPYKPCRRDELIP